MKNNRLRIALIAGSLDVGGAEKQLVYIARTLQAADADLRLYYLIKGEFYEPMLTDMGISMIWVGKNENPVLRLTEIYQNIKHWKPHFIQSTHFYTNIYASGIAPIVRAISVGSIRNDTFHELDANRFWGPILLKSPSSLITNSYSAKRNACLVGVNEKKIQVLPNVIDLIEFDQKMVSLADNASSSMIIQFVLITRLVHQKRVDRFLSALAAARLRNIKISGLVVGDGPELSSLKEQAENLYLFPDGVKFLGARNDIPAILGGSNVLVLTSDHEGFPNVILEAMAACLPVITTPAGDAGEIVIDRVTGYVVPFDQIEGITDRMVELAESEELRKKLGDSGRIRAEQYYSFETLQQNLFSIYKQVAKNHGDSHLLNLIETGNASV